MQNGYAPVTAAGLYGQDAGAGAAYGIAVPSNIVAMPGAVSVEQGEPGTGASVMVPKDFWRSSAFGLILLVALVVYLDVRIVNR